MSLCSRPPCCHAHDVLNPPAFATVSLAGLDRHRHCQDGQFERLRILELFGLLQLPRSELRSWVRGLWVAWPHKLSKTLFVQFFHES